MAEKHSNRDYDNHGNDNNKLYYLFISAGNEGHKGRNSRGNYWGKARLRGVRARRQNGVPSSCWLRREWTGGALYFEHEHLEVRFFSLSFSFLSNLLVSFYFFLFSFSLSLKGHIIDRILLNTRQFIPLSLFPIPLHYGPLLYTNFPLHLIAGKESCCWWMQDATTTATAAMSRGRGPWARNTTPHSGLFMN